MDVGSAVIASECKNRSKIAMKQDISTVSTTNPKSLINCKEKSTAAALVLDHRSLPQCAAKFLCTRMAHAASDNVSAACCDAPVLVDERLIGDLVECVETVNTS